MSEPRYHATDEFGIRNNYSTFVYEYDCSLGPCAGLSITVRDGHILLPGDTGTVRMLREVAKDLEDTLTKIQAEKENAA